MTTYTTFFLPQSNATLPYQVAFYSVLSQYAKVCANGWGARVAWDAAWAWGVDGMGLSSDELVLVVDLVSILSANQETTVSYFSGGETVVASIHWNSNEKYPTVS